MDGDSEIDEGLEEGPEDVTSEGEVASPELEDESDSEDDAVVEDEADEDAEETEFGEEALPAEIEDAKPVGDGEYEVRQGDSISSIAYEYGHFWKTLWLHSANAALRKARGNPDVLLPGDRLAIPEIEVKHYPAATDARHRFVRQGVPAMLRLRLVDAAGEPRAGIPYTLNVGHRSFTGKSDPDGWIKHPVVPNAREGKLLIDDGQEEYILDLGHVDPVESITGIQARLNNLGYDCGLVDGIFGPRTRSALRDFQDENGLPPSGEPDKATREKLLQVHGG